MLTLKQKIAQMLLMGFDGCDINNSSPVAQWINKGLGGVLLFNKDVLSGKTEKNLANLNQIRKLTTNLQQMASNHSTIPLFIAIDYEGGKVDRLATIDGCFQTMSAKASASLTEKDFFDYSHKMAKTLKSLGFNLNFAPIVDLHCYDDEGIIGALERSFSTNPAVVTNYAQTFVKAFNEQNIICCYKHFPGHGSAKGDTHEGFVDVSSHFHENELVPYEKLVNNPDLHAMIMTAHVINNQLDSDNLPATLSKPILTELLRNKIEYDGVLISDDLQMHAIASYYSLPKALELTINAGADMIIIANQLSYIDAEEVISMIESLINNGLVSIDRIEQSCKRILQLKMILQ